MKKILVTVFALVLIMALGSCANSNDASQPSVDNTPEGATPISKGYSIQSLGLDLSGDSDDMTVSEGKYSPDVKINGRYTAIFDEDNKAYVQGFYKEDLKTEKIYIGGRVLSESDMSDKIIFETEDFVVYDITSYIDGDCCSFEYELNIIDSLNTPQTTDTENTDEISAKL